MNVIEQLTWLLNDCPAFWNSDNCNGNEITGGIALAIVNVTGGVCWRVTWSFGSEPALSPVFRTQRDAKRDLYGYLTRRRDELLDAVTPAARCELYMS